MTVMNRNLRTPIIASTTLTPPIITNPISITSTCNFTPLFQRFNFFTQNPNGSLHNELFFLHHSTPLQHPQGVSFLQLHSLGCSLQLHLPHSLSASHSLSLRLLLHPSSDLHNRGCCLGLCRSGGQ